MEEIEEQELGRSLSWGFTRCSEGNKWRKIEIKKEKDSKERKKMGNKFRLRNYKKKIFEKELRNIKKELRKEI